MKRLLRRISSHNVKAERDVEEPVPPLPSTPTQQNGAATSTPPATPRREEMYKAMTLPVRLVSPSSLRLPNENGPTTSRQDGSSAAHDQSDKNGAVLPASIPTPEMSKEQKIWNAVNNPTANANQPEVEKFLDKVEDRGNAAAGASSGVVDTIKTIAANEEVQAIGNVILKGVPALMSALESLSKVHPFAAVAFLPFQFAYKQEMKRHDNERLRMALFESIKDVMLVTVEMKGVGITMNDTRTTPDGLPVVTRLTTLGEKMKDDIEGCYNALDAMQKQSLIVKFCKASSWNEQLAHWKVTFQGRRQELQFALTLNTATTVQDMSVMVKDMHEIMMEFASYKTPQERKIEAFFKAHGGQDAVMANESLCAELLKLQNDQTVAHNIQSTYATAAVAGAARRTGLGGGPADPQKDAVTALLKEYRADISVLIQQNMDGFSKRLDMSLHLLSEDLTSTMHKESSRVITFLKGGPHMRLNDKIMRQVWKEQGWRGSAKTRTLVLALRDYLVEQAEHAHGELPKLPAPQRDDEDGDGDPNMGEHLPDSWMLDYLQPMRLRNLQQVLDPDTSGFTTITELNAFTQSRYKDWSLPRWISYWAVGWQIYATRYCNEIDEIYNQMILIRKQAGLQMPGNKRYINDYIAETWPIVVGLTSAIERFEGSDWLAEQFKDYVEAQETVFSSALERIKYDIDSTDVIHDVMGAEPIERWIFMFIAIIMRRHLMKMHLCLSGDMNEEELFDDSYTLKYVAEAAWLRYKDLSEFYKHQQINDMKQNFEWFSCGLFKNYYAWNEWSNDEYYRLNEIITYSAVSTIKEVKLEDTKSILIHAQQDIAHGKIDGLTIADLAAEVKKQDLIQTSGDPAVPISQLLEAITGIWFGFHVLKSDGRPYTGMSHLKLTASIEEGKLVLRGIGSSFGYTPLMGKIEGTLDPAAASEGTIKATLNLVLGVDEYRFDAVLMMELDILHGAVCSVSDDSYPDGNFFMKRTPRDSIMCYRPLLPRRLTPRELWTFAYDAVVDDLRRRKPSLAYFAERFGKIRRCLQLLYRRNLPGQPSELSELRKGFALGEYVEVRLLSGWYTRATEFHQPLGCDACASTITRSRVVCLSCDATNSVEFDAKEECVTVVTLSRRNDLATPHLPTHVLLKTRDRLLPVDHATVKWRATNCVELARRLYTAPSPDPGPNMVEAEPGDVATAIQPEDADRNPSEVVDAGPAEVKTTNGKSDNDEAAATQVESVNTASEQPSGGASTSTTTLVLEAAGATNPQVAIEDHRDDESQASQESDTESTYSDSDSEREPEGEPITLNCLVCQQRVSTPCWYCIDCKQKDAFVCSACETAIESLYPWDYLRRYREEVHYHKDIPTPEKKSLATFDPFAHNIFHNLVRFGNTDSISAPEVPVTEAPTSPRLPPDPQDALRELEHRLLRRMEEDKNHLQGQLQEHVSGVERRLARIEELLQALLPVPKTNSS